MTDEELGDLLDLARAQEAVKRLMGPLAWDAWIVDGRAATIQAAALAREGWVPVDNDLVEAKKLAACWMTSGPSFEGPILAGIKRGRELEREAPDLNKYWAKPE